MKAQEWLDRHDNIAPHAKTAYGEFAAEIIREQQERIDRLTAKIAELKAADDLCNAAKTLSDCSRATMEWQKLYDALFAELEGK